jgi:hypothetical protein
MGLRIKTLGILSQQCSYADCHTFCFAGCNYAEFHYADTFFIVLTQHNTQYGGTQQYNTQYNGIHNCDTECLVLF